MSEIRENRVPVALIQPSPILLRSVDREDEQYQDLVASVRHRGVDNAITIRPIPAAQRVEGGPEYYVTDGLQRWSAAKDAGVFDVPVHVKDIPDSEVLYSQIIANVHRVDTKPKEYADALKRILEMSPMMTKQDLADQLNKSTSWLDQRLSLTKLSKEVGELVDDGKVTLNNAIVLAKLSDEDQAKFLNDAMTKDSGSFGAAVQQHLKEQRKAIREGRPQTPVAYVPPPKLIKVEEICTLYKEANNVATFLKEQGVTVNTDTVAAATVALQRVVCLDPLSYKARVDQYEADKAQREKAAELKKAEREKQKAFEAEETKKRLAAELGV